MATESGAYRIRVIVFVDVLHGYQAMGCVWMVLTERLSGESAGGGEVIESAKEIRPVAVAVVMWVYVLENLVIDRELCYLSTWAYAYRKERHTSLDLQLSYYCALLHHSRDCHDPESVLANLPAKEAEAVQ